MDYSKYSDKELLELLETRKDDAARLNTLQMSKKLNLNSLFGAAGNPYFRYFDQRIAESITLCGQLAIRWVGEKVDEFLNKAFKTNSEQYVIYTDTDSIYLNLERFVEKFCSGLEHEEIVTKLDEFGTQVMEPFMAKVYDELAEYMNCYENAMFMDREIIADKAFWSGKKRYVCNVIDNEGVRYEQPKLKIMGLEVVKSSTPDAIRSLLSKTIPVILHQEERDLKEFVERVRSEFNSLTPDEIAFPKGVNNIEDYVDGDSYRKGTPINVRAAILYNNKIKDMGLEQKYELIESGSKMRFLYLKTPNPVRENVIGFPMKLPPEFNLEEFVDYDVMFDKVYRQSVENMVEKMGWTSDNIATLEDFFG